MTSVWLLGLGFVVGMQHALEADHLAAVSSIATGRTNMGGAVKHGLAWGLGHTLTLFLFAGAAMLLGSAISGGVAMWLEAAVGIMLVALGGQVLWRLWRSRVHVHPHSHPGRKHRHIHAHRSAGEGEEHGEHVHEHGFRWKTFIIGLIHGMAGSAALLAFAVSQVVDRIEGLIYILVFGIGSMVGMGILSSAIAVPLVISWRFMTRVNRGLQAAVGTVTIAIGATTLYETLAAYDF